jgi:hypothetical protein
VFVHPDAATAEEERAAIACGTCRVTAPTLVRAPTMAGTALKAALMPPTSVVKLTWPPARLVPVM